MLRAFAQVRQRAFGPGEVDQRLAATQALGEVGGDEHAAGLTGKAGSVLAQHRAGGDVECTGELAVAAVAHRLHQHLPHAATGTGHANAVQARCAAHRADPEVSRGG
ncbi:hypothetical protein FQZ97_827360 [compost metagenome]